jgi:hypothetical protein
MRKYAEVNKGFVVGFHKRSDKRIPEFVPPRFAIRVDNISPQPKVGDEYDGRFGPPTKPNPNLEVPETNKEILEETRELVKELINILTPGGPP